VHDSLASGAVPPVLLGHGQGGALALALALVIPDYLSGIIAINGVLPAFSGWSPCADADALPVLMVTDTTAKSSSETEAALMSAGCRLIAGTVTDTALLGPSVSKVITEAALRSARCRVIAGTATDTALLGPSVSKVISDWLRADLRA